MAKHWAWISGWGIAPERFKAAAEHALPAFEHTVLHPQPNACSALLELNADHIGAYSLGSLLLLDQQDAFPNSVKLYALAPILGFTTPMQRGGSTKPEALHSLQTRLSRNPSQALKLFHRLADLDEPSNELPYPLDDLIWGLDQLATRTISATRQDRVQAIIGNADRLCQPEHVSGFFNQATACTSGHNYNDLLKALAHSLAQ